LASSSVLAVEHLDWVARRAARVLPQDPCRPAGHPVQVLDGQQHLDEGVGGRLAVLAVDQVDQLAGAAGQQRLVGQQPPPAPVEAEPGPPRGRLASPRHGLGDLLGPVHREGPDELAAGRAGRVEGRAAGGGRPVVGDCHAVDCRRSVRSP